MSDGADKLDIFVSEWEPAPARLERGDVVCAIGDVHGYARHLETLTNWVCENALHEAEKTRHLVFLGDYIDRGPLNIPSLAFLDGLAPPGIDVVRLVGNHEEFLIEFLRGEGHGFDFVESWVRNGGLATLAELGIEYDDLFRNSVAELRALVEERLPAEAARCLDRLIPSFRSGAYMFVHAGVRPDTPVDLADVKTLTTIREPFLSGPGWAHEFAVVHGHTICAPEVTPHRVAVDAGVYRSGLLACAHFEDDRVRFVIAAEATDLDEFMEKERNGRLLARRWSKA